MAAAHLEQGTGFAGVEVPPQVASRLLFEQKLFAEGSVTSSCAPDKLTRGIREAEAGEHAEVEKRREEILAAKVAAAKAEVDHVRCSFADSWRGEGS